MRPDRLLSRFLRLVQIHSPSGGEGEVAAYIQDWARGLDLPFETDDAHTHFGGTVGNLIVRVPAGLEESVFR